MRHAGGTDLQFTPDGKELVSMGTGWIRRWDTKTGKAIHAFGADPEKDEAWEWQTCMIENKTAYIVPTAVRHPVSNGKCMCTTSKPAGRYDRLSSKGIPINPSVIGIPA